MGIICTTLLLSASVALSYLSPYNEKHRGKGLTIINDPMGWRVKREFRPILHHVKDGLFVPSSFTSCYCSHVDFEPFMFSMLHLHEQSSSAQRSLTRIRAKRWLDLAACCIVPQKTGCTQSTGEIWPPHIFLSGFPWATKCRNLLPIFPFFA